MSSSASPTPSPSSVEDLVAELTEQGVDWSALLSVLDHYGAVPVATLDNHFWLHETGLLTGRRRLTPLGMEVLAQILMLQQWKNLCSTS